MQSELTMNQGTWRALARAALVAAVCAATIGLATSATAGAQDPETATTQPGTTVVETTNPSDGTVPPDAIADEGDSAPGATDEAQSDEKLLNLIIIGLLVLAAVIAVATLLFWKSTAPDDDDDDAVDGDGDAKPSDEAQPEVATVEPSKRPVTPPSGAEPAEPVEAPASPAESTPAAPRRRVMASFPSSPLGDVAHPVSGSVPAVVEQDPPAAPADAADEQGHDITTLGSGASPGRPSVPPPDAARPGPQNAGAYQVPPPDELPPQPDRPFADAETRPPVERAPSRDATKVRKVPVSPQPPSDSAIVTTSKPNDAASPSDDSEGDGPPVVVRRRRRDRPAGPWGEGVGGGHRPDVPPLAPPDPQDQGYQRGVRVVRPDEPEKADDAADDVPGDEG